MKKIVIIILCVFLITACGKKEIKQEDYNKYTFTNISWTRTTEVDTETIRFNKDGSFTYSCACGNPVNDSDLCDTYSYNEETKEIKLDCFETTNETVETIKIVNHDEKTLELDFNGEIRKFTKE